MWFFIALGMIGALFLCLDGAVSGTIAEAQAGPVDLNDRGCLKRAYLIVGGLLVAALAFVALVCFTYPLRH